MLRPNTDHKLSKADAELLMGIIALPRDLRIECLRKLVLSDRGREGLLMLFADFIGLSNQVVASTRTFIEDYLVINHNMMLDGCNGASAINLPTIFGALNGVTIAIKPTRSMCHGCAFRLGTPANQSPVTSLDANWAVEEENQFMCHEHLSPDGEPVKTCAGYAKSMIALRTARG